MFIYYSGSIVYEGVFMLEIKNAKLKDIIKLNKVFNHPYQNMNFYSDFTGSILHHILRKKCYLVFNNKALQGVIFLKDNKEVNFIPAVKAFSFFKLLYVLQEYFSLNGFKLSIRYKKLNPLSYKKYFNISIKENIKYMYINTYDFRKINDFNDFNDSLSVRQMIINKDESIRVELQNKIFADVHGRKELTLNEVYNEENGLRFLKDLCFILEVSGIPAGYGQILRMDNSFFLVNFGIIPDYQRKGYGYYFLGKIIEQCRLHGIKDLYLTVDAGNFKAISLYKKANFSELYGNVTIIL